MAEYIEREALMKELSESVEPFNTGSVFRAIRKQLAADVAPVVHGRWIESKEYVYSPDGCKKWISFYHCSECKALNNSSTGYCPNCGARMVGE